MTSPAPSSDPHDLAPRSELTAAVLLSAVIAAIGGLLFGYDTAVISGAEKAIQAAFALDALLAWLHRRLGADRDHRRLGRHRAPRGFHREETDALPPGGPLPGLVAGLRTGTILVDPGGFPIRRGDRHRRRVGRDPDVHRGDLAAASERAAGRHQPAQCRGRDPPLVHLELCDQPLLPVRGRVALDAGGGGPARRRLSSPSSP